MAVAATGASQPVNPLVVLSVFGTQGAAQAVCSQGALAVASAGAAAATQAAPGCVLPATDVAPTPPLGQAAAFPPLPPSGNFGVNWLLLGLGSLALIAGLATLFDDDDDDGASVPISPA